MFLTYTTELLFNIVFNFIEYEDKIQNVNLDGKRLQF